MSARKRLSPKAACALEAGLSLILAGTPFLLALISSEGALLGLSLAIAHYFTPALAAPLAFYGARRGANAYLSALLPLTLFTLVWYAARLAPPAVPALFTGLTGVVGAAAGQEARKRAKGKKR